MSDKQLAFEKPPSLSEGLVFQGVEKPVTDIF